MREKAIIWDWGGIFVDAATKEFYSGGEEILKYCKNKGYRMGLAVIASEYEKRKEQIENSDLVKYFEIFRIAPLTKEQIKDPDFPGKDKLYDEIVEYFELPREDIWIVDDRTIRGIKYGTQHGHPVIWIQKGRFEHELPDESTGQPDYIIHDSEELYEVL